MFDGLQEEYDRFLQKKEREKLFPGGNLDKEVGSENEDFDMVPVEEYFSIFEGRKLSDYSQEEVGEFQDKIKELREIYNRSRYDYYKEVFRAVPLSYTGRTGLFQRYQDNYLASCVDQPYDFNPRTQRAVLGYNYRSDEDFDKAQENDILLDRQPIPPVPVSGEAYQACADLIEGGTETMEKDLRLLIDYIHFAFAILRKSRIMGSPGYGEFRGHEIKQLYSDLLSLLDNLSVRIKEKNYFLGTYIERIKKSNFPYGDFTDDYQLISENMYIRTEDHHEIKLSRNNKEDAAKITQLLTELAKLEKDRDKKNVLYHRLRECLLRDSLVDEADDLEMEIAILDRDIRSKHDEIESYFTRITNEDATVAKNTQEAGLDRVNSFLFLFMYLTRTRFDVEKKLSITLADYTIAEQYQLALYLYGKNEQEVDIISGKIAQLGPSFIKNLALYGAYKDVPDILLGIDNTAESKELLNLSAEILKIISEIRDFIPSIISEKVSLTKDDLSKIEKKYFEHVYALLAETANSQDANMIQKFQDVKLATQLSLLAFKELKKNGLNILVEDVASFGLVRVSRNEISGETLKEMKGIYIQNMLQNSYSKETIDELLEKFDESMSSSDTHAYLISIDEKVKGFVVFKKEQGDSYFVHALNVDPVFQGFRLADSMIHEALIAESKNHTLNADCNPWAINTMRYFEELNFVGTAFHAVDGGVVDITNDEKIVSQLKTKNLSTAEILLLNGIDGVTISSAASLKEIDFSIVNNTMLLTRLFKDGDKYFAVFENVVS